MLTLGATTPARRGASTHAWSGHRRYGSNVMQIAQAIVWVLGAYAAAGLLFAVAFAWRGAGVVDPAARKGTLGFRLLIVPGSAALWPVLAVKWMRASGTGSRGEGHA